MGIDNVLHSHRHPGHRSLFCGGVDRTRLCKGENGIEEFPGSDDILTGSDMVETGLRHGLGGERAGGDTGGNFGSGKRIKDG